MLITTAVSGAAKTAGLAVTYRASSGNPYGNCPSNCALMPAGERGTLSIDWQYFEALVRAVPRKGIAFTYTHFSPRKWLKKWQAMRGTGPATMINHSADTLRAAVRSCKAGINTVLALPEDKVRKHWRQRGVRFVQCPATYQDKIGCNNCGGDVPLCARDRDYVIVFPAHGAAKRKVGEGSGGCYASGGNVGLHWRKLARRDESVSDAAKLSDFVEDLPRGTVLRHHVAGDLG